MIEFDSKTKWYKSWENAKTRCTNPKHERYKYYGARGIKFLLTKEEVKSLWVRDNGSLMKRPSLDRINNDGNYELSNCRFIEFMENWKKEYDTRKRKVVQLTRDGNIVRVWDCFGDIARSYGFSPRRFSSVCDCCAGRKKSYKGYIWKYIEDVNSDILKEYVLVSREK